jgi:hypothetical protein
MASKLEMTIAEVNAKYPQFFADRKNYEKRVILESLQWRVDRPDAKSLSVRQDIINSYFPYLSNEAVRTVQSAFRARFYDNKDDTDYSEYWNEPALSKVFASLGNTNAALQRILIDGEGPDGTLTAREGFIPADIRNSISIEYNGLIFGGRLKSEAHFYAVIDTIKNF